jgi:hypothetical protein
LKKIIWIISAIFLVSCNDVNVTNTSSGNGTTVSYNATHGGWTHIKAVGAKAPAAQGSDLAPSPASVTLSWNDATATTGTVSSYNLYRSTSSRAQNFTNPIATGITTTAKTYTDSTVTSGTTYYYTLGAMVNGKIEFISLSSADREVKVIVPPANMVLLHRWAANKEMCELVGKTANRSQNYRCASTAPGTSGGYLDLESSLFVDMFEQGCNYTATNACTDATVNGGAAAPCIGIRDDAFVSGNVSANAGSVYYSRYSGRCYLNTSAGSGTTWVQATSGTATQRQAMGSNAPGLPPLVHIDQLESQDVCVGQTVAGTPSPSTKRLLKRREQVLVSAWDSAIADATINTMEIGANLHTTNYCNSSYASPQGNNNTDVSGSAPTLAYTNNVLPSATNRDTLPGCLFQNCAADATLTELIRSVRTGSNATNVCVSRYGAQDLVGNVWEWTSDQIQCTSPTCVGVSGGTADSSNIDFSGSVLFDGTTQSPVADTTFTAYGKIQLPIGVPVQNTYTADESVSLTAAQLHGDRFYISSAATGTRAAIAGGSWSNGSFSGRFALNLLNGPTGANRNLGFRCALPAE